MAQAQQILIKLHQLLEDERREKEYTGEAIDVYNGFRVKTISTLLEFIAAYGLLPWLPPEAAEIKKMRYVTQPSSGMSTEQPATIRQGISLRDLAMPLVEIATETGKGVEPVLRDSILPIVTCAAAVSLDVENKSSTRNESQLKTFHDFAGK